MIAVIGGSNPFNVPSLSDSIGLLLQEIAKALREMRGQEKRAPGKLTSPGVKGFLIGEVRNA